MQTSIASPFDPSVSFQQPGQAPTSNGWASPTQPRLPDGYPDDWVEADGYPNDWIAPASTQVDDGYPNDWIASSPAAGGDRHANSLNGPEQEPDGYPNDWITPGRGGTPGGSQWPQSNLVQRVSDDAAARPGWGFPVPQSGWEPWADHFIKGLQGLANYLRSRGGYGGGGGSDDGDCYSRWEAEDARCGQFWPLESKRPFYACKDRAVARRDRCIRNNGRPDPGEPPEYNWNDFM
jgi:hypothetical protein